MDPISLLNGIPSGKVVKIDIQKGEMKSFIHYWPWQSYIPFLRIEGHHLIVTCDDDPVSINMFNDMIHYFATKKASIQFQIDD